MDVTWSSRLEDGSFDAFVLTSPAGHVAQTSAWADVARTGAHVVTRFATVREAGALVGAAMVLRPAVAGIPLPWAWIERGPVVSRPADVGRVTEAIARAARHRGVVRLRVMPYWADEDAVVAENELRRVGFRDVQQPDGAHASTLRLNIAGKGDAELFGDQVRSRMRLAEKAGVTARRGTREDWAALRAMHAELLRSQGLREKPQAWWAALQAFASDDRRGALFACDLGARLIAAAVVLRHGPQATYAWGASVADKVPFTKAIPPLVAAIRWSREVGCAIFDLGGIPLEEDRDPKRNAIAAFKLYFTKSRVRLVREHGKGNACLSTEKETRA